MRAVFQGEFHTSRADWQALNSHIDDGGDALFIEQRKDTVDREDWSLGYLYFLNGVYLFFLLQKILSRAPDDPEYDIPVHDKIDLTLPEVYSEVPLIWTTIAGIIAVPILLIGVLVPYFPIPIIQNSLVAVLLFSILVKLLMVLGSPFIFSFILILVEEVLIGARDRHMANEISRISEENDYGEVVVSCGAMHLARLPELLEESGWETEENDSRYGLPSKLWRILIR